MRRLFAIAAVWHLAVVLTIFFAGRAQIFPQAFDPNGLGTFAFDSRNYRVEAEDMAKLIQQGRVRDWINYKSSFHVRPYSLSFALLGGVFGFNVLSAEPLNLIYYLLILACVYALAREAFGQTVARLATLVIAFWPSLVLHTTQLIRDALFIPSLLLLALALLLCVNRILSLKQGWMVGAAGVIGALLVWLCRGDMWEMISMVLAAGALVCLLMQIKERRFLVGNTVAMVAIIILAFWIPRVVPAYRQPNDPLSAETTQKAKSSSPLSMLSRRVGLLRHKFIASYPLAGSNIDTNVELNQTSAIVRYLPRAALIGFFSPFPNMWVARGAQVGLAGRLIAGAEMLLLYPLLGLAGLTVVKQRRRPAVWLLFLIAGIGCTALGFVVVNLATLYRMRYGFFILLIILGLEGLLLLFDRTSRAPIEIESQARVEQELLAR